MVQIFHETRMKKSEQKHDENNSIQAKEQGETSVPVKN